MGDNRIEKYFAEWSEEFRYKLLSRMKQDCEYYLGNGNRRAKYLWAKSVPEQIAYMKAIWNSFPAGGKPEWLSYHEILNYEQKMTEAHNETF